MVSQELLQASESERDSLAQQCEDEKRGRAELEIRLIALAEKVHAMHALSPVARHHSLPGPEAI